MRDQSANSDLLVRKRSIMASVKVRQAIISFWSLFLNFLFYRFFSQQVRVGGRNKNKNKIHYDHFPIEIKNRRKHEIVFPLILIQLENGLNEFSFHFIN